MKAPNCCSWKNGGIVIGVVSLIGSFPISASGDVSVSLHFLIVSGCLLYGIHKEKSEFLLPYLVELVVILIQCALSIIKFSLLEPYNDGDNPSDAAYDLFYDRPKHLTQKEKRYILAVFVVTTIAIFSFWCVIFRLYRRMRYCKDVDHVYGGNNDGVRTVECGKVCPSN